MILQRLDVIARACEGESRECILVEASLIDELGEFIPRMPCLQNTRGRDYDGPAGRVRFVQDSSINCVHNGCIFL